MKFGNKDGNTSWSDKENSEIVSKHFSNFFNQHIDVN